MLKLLKSKTIEIKDLAFFITENGDLKLYIDGDYYLFNEDGQLKFGAFSGKKISIPSKITFHDFRNETLKPKDKRRTIPVHVGILF